MASPLTIPVGNIRLAIPSSRLSSHIYPSPGGGLLRGDASLILSPLTLVLIKRVIDYSISARYVVVYERVYKEWGGCIRRIQWDRMKWWRCLWTIRAPPYTRPLTARLYRTASHGLGAPGGRLCRLTPDPWQLDCTARHRTDSGRLTADCAALHQTPDS